jgi:hypothetical protein
VRRDRHEFGTQLVELGQLGRHHLVALGELSKLVAAGGSHPQLVREVPVRDRLHAALQETHRPVDRAREPDADQGREQRGNEQRRRGDLLGAGRLVSCLLDARSRTRLQLELREADPPTHAIDRGPSLVGRDAVDDSRQPGERRRILPRRELRELRDGSVDLGRDAVQRVAVERVRHRAEIREVPRHAIPARRVVEEHERVFAVLEIVRLAPQTAEQQRRLELLIP